MTTFSEIEITFNEDLPIGGTLRFDIDVLPFTGGTKTWDWVTTRQAPFEVSTFVPTPVIGEASAITFEQAFNIDVNNSLTYEVTRVANVVTIKSFIARISFANPAAFLAPITPANVQFSINNSTATPFEITDFVISEADTNPCTNVKVTVTTNELATNIINPPNGANLNNPYIYEIPRGNLGTVFTAENATGDQVQNFFNLPSILDASNMEIIQEPSPLSAVVTVNMLQTYNLTLEYSTDGLTWQTSNVFNLVNASYTMYVRDNLGCSISKDFIVNSVQGQIAVLEIPKANSIRYAARVTHNDCGNYKNDENTLSCESDVKLPYKEIQQFQTCDIIRTQFKSSYETITAEVLNLTDGTVDPLTILQVTNNLGRKDRRDAKVFSINATQTGIYFTSGNLYDYVTNAITGTYVLNGNLPEWGIINNYINVLGTWYVIRNLFYDEDRGATAMVIDNIYTGTDDVTINVFSEYNIDNFEVYEFSVDFGVYIDKQLQIRITNESETFTNTEHISEQLDIQIRHKNTLEIEYYSDRNTDIIYATGIRHKIRLPYLRKEGNIEVETEVNKSDTTAYLIESKNYETEEITFEPVTKEIMRKLVIALTQRILIIDGVGYRINDDIDIDPSIEDTNLYEVKAVLVKTTNNLSSNSGIGDFNTGVSEIPTLLEQGDSYLEY